MEKVNEPFFSFAEVQYSNGDRMFVRALKLFTDGKVNDFEEVIDGYIAKVDGTSIYDVYVSNRSIDICKCNCYMGERDMVCKHVLAVSLMALKLSGKWSDGNVEVPDNISDAKKEVSVGMRKIKGYTGPSRTWFRYQADLAVGCGIILESISGLPATRENTVYVWKLALRIIKKLSHGGVDDSDGVIGDCVYRLLEQLARYAKEDVRLLPKVQSFCEHDTGFGFEENLMEMIKDFV